MKRIALLLPLFVALVLSGSESNAQVRFSLGGKFGLNLGNLSYDPELPTQISKSTRLGLMFGGVFEVAIAGPMCAQMELLYVQTGTKLEGPLFVNAQQQAINGTITVKLSYLQIPLLAKAKFPLPGSVSPFVYVGPALGINLSAGETDEAPGLGSQDFDLKDVVSGTDFGLIFGGGAEIKIMSKVGLTGEFRYSLGLSDIAKEAAGQQSHRKNKTSGIQFFVGAMVHL